jgi:hypothetical protein
MWKRRKCDINGKGGRATSQNSHAGQDGRGQTGLFDQKGQTLWRSKREMYGVKNRGEILTFSVLICVPDAEEEDDDDAPPPLEAAF